jgi:hypothetical protein
MGIIGNIYTKQYCCNIWNQVFLCNLNSREFFFQIIYMEQITILPVVIILPYHCWLVLRTVKDLEQKSIILRYIVFYIPRAQRPGPPGYIARRYLVVQKLSYIMGVDRTFLYTITLLGSVLVLSSIFVSLHLSKLGSHQKFAVLRATCTM